MGLMKEFYEREHFASMVPVFDYYAEKLPFADPMISELYVPHLLSNPDRTEMIAYYLPTVRFELTMTGLQDKSYRARWFNPRTGEYTPVAEFTPVDGGWKMPAKPDDKDWLLKIETV